MTARESVKNYPSALREMTNYSVRGIKKICKEADSRTPGSDNENKAQKILETELSECCDDVKEECFKARKDTKVFLILGVIFAVAAIGLMLAKVTIIGGFCAGVALVLIVVPFLLPQAEATYLYGIKNAVDTAQKRIVLLANYDCVKKSEGAGNNLSGCYSALSVVRFMQRQKLDLNNTEVWIVLTSADTMNMAGTLHFAKNHKFDDIETIFVSLDSIVNPDAISAFYADDTAKNAVENASKLTDKKLASTAKASEAKAIAATGAHFAKLSACNKGDITGNDSADKLNLRAIESVVDVLLETTFALEK